MPFVPSKDGTRIGYVMGAGDEIPQSLRRLGYEVELLTDEALASTDLTRFDAIVLGIRAFNTRASLVTLKQRLHDYVAQGGTEVVLYTVNTGFPGINAGMVTESIGPYPFKVSRNRVTEEDATVRFLLPEGGVSAIDAPGQRFHDPAADAALFEALEATVAQTPQRRLIRLPQHINDPAFAQAVVDHFRAIVR